MSDGLFLLTLLSLLLLLLLGLTARRSLFKPLASLSAAARELAAGKEPEFGPTHRSLREIRLLGESLERMSGVIRERERRLEQQVFWSRLLGNLADAIAEHQTMDSILTVAMTHLVDSFDAAAGAITTRDQERDCEELTKVIVRLEELRPFAKHRGTPRIDVGTEAVRRSLKPNEPQFISVSDKKIAALPTGYHRALEAAAVVGLTGVVVLPVHTDEEHLGTLWLAFSDREALTDEEEEFLKRLGSHISIAIQHSVTQKELEKTQKVAMQKERLNAMGQMASGIAHDINNSLLPITAYADLVLEWEDLSETSTRYMHTIKEAAWNIQAATTRMKKFYRESEERTAREVAVDQLLKGVIDLTRPRWNDMPQQEGRDIELSERVAADLPPIIGFESDLREALTNIVFNACDAMPEGGRLSIEAFGQGGTIVVSVSDTGIGMSEDERQRATEPFFTTKGEGGTGMGLGMVHGAMQRHDGRMEIDSVKGEGTTVSLFFPVQERDGDSDRLEGAATAGSEGYHEKLTIICVDDDEMALNALGDVLDCDDHESLLFRHGEPALEELRRRVENRLPTDVIITDLGMPGIDGREIARRARELDPRLPVLLISGGGESLEPHEVALGAVDAVISKPPALDELRETLREHVPAAGRRGTK